MGMDYRYSGSCSYPRFDREVTAVAQLFGGVKTEHLKNREETENERPCGYWFGFMSSDNSNKKRFKFPEGTDEILVKWFNDIYGDFDEDETKHIWELIQTHPEIEEISWQIWNELKESVESNDYWYIHK